MRAIFPRELITALEQLGTACTGDVPGLVAQACAYAPQPFADETALASALEQAGESRARNQDRTAAWWLACGIALIRSSNVTPPQEEAEITTASWFGELAQSAAANAPLPAAACWLVGGRAEPPLAVTTIELARRNATTHLERLDAELAARNELLRTRLAQHGEDTSVAAMLQAVLQSYSVASADTRAALFRVIAHVSARGRTGALAESGAAALSDVDQVLAPLHARIAQTRGALGFA